MSIDLLSRQYNVALCPVDPHHDPIEQLLHLPQEQNGVPLRLVVCTGLPLLPCLQQWALLTPCAQQTGLWLACACLTEDGTTATLLCAPDGQADLGRPCGRLVQNALGLIGLSAGGNSRDFAPWRRLSRFQMQLGLQADSDDTVTEEQWELLLQARAVENSAWMVSLHGDSGRIVDPNGKVVGKTDGMEHICIQTVDLDLMEQVRAQIPVLKHFRTDLFSDLGADVVR